ncbi:hypothetical protein CYMTET_55505, partial [Cymbomonas tetramitiformis]
MLRQHQSGIWEVMLRLITKNLHQNFLFGWLFGIIFSRLLQRCEEDLKSFLRKTSVSVLLSALSKLYALFKPKAAITDIKNPPFGEPLVPTAKSPSATEDICAADGENSLRQAEEIASPTQGACGGPGVSEETLAAFKETLSGYSGGKDWTNLGVKDGVERWRKEIPGQELPASKVRAAVRAAVPAFEFLSLSFRCPCRQNVTEGPATRTCYP